MTDTATRTEPTTGIPLEPGTTGQISPEALVVGANVRSNVAIEKPFIESIRTHGVLVPISVWFDDIAGAWQVLDGQRRTLAAREAGLPLVPVWVVPKVAAEDQRIVGQLTVNDHRKALDDAEETTALHQLALFGMSADSIRRKTSIPTKRVQQALTVASTPAAAQILAEQPVTLENAAAIAEFADEPAVLEHLTEYAANRPDQLSWQVERAREQRKNDAALAAARAELEAAGRTVVDERPAPPAVRIEQLVDKDGHRIEETDALAAEDLVAHVSLYYGGQTGVSFYVLDPKAHGWHDLYASSSTAAAPKPTKEERKAARERAADWRTASTLRVQALRQIVSNRIATRFHPACHALIAAHTLDQLGGSMPQKQDLADLLGAIGRDDNGTVLHGYSDYYGLGAWLDTHPDRTLNAALAAAIVHAEHALSTAAQGKPYDTAVPAYQRYLRLTTDLGHTLTPIEQRAAGLDTEPDSPTAD